MATGSQPGTNLVQFDLVLERFKNNVKMPSSTGFEVRFMKPSETSRVASLARSLQEYQKKKDCSRLPRGEDFLRELVHVDNVGNLVANNNGTFTAVAVDLGKIGGTDHCYIVGYLIYTQSFSIIHGRQLYINSFFILQEYRRCGLGKQLIEFMKRHGKSLGHKGFDVPFMNNNTAGQTFYKKFGAYLTNEEYQLVGVDLKRGSG